MTALHQIHGDWFDAGPRLPSNHFHGVVADVPYLYAFMSREFDRQHRHWPGSTDGERAFAWNLDVCRELLRVLVPGGFAMIFQGSRTYHRLAYAAEVAGFEVLPMVVGITGQSMAQGAAVDKAIDRERREDFKPAAKVARWLVDRMEERGHTRRTLCEHFGAENIAQQWTTHWTDGAVKPRVPTWEQWQALRDLLGFGDEMDAEVWRLNGRKGKPGDAWEKREKVGEGYQVRVDKASAVAPQSAGKYDITAPATDLARAFHGHHSRIRDQLMPVAVLMKPVDGSFARNAARWGVAGFDVDGARIEVTDTDAAGVWSRRPKATEGISQTRSYAGLDGTSPKRRERWNISRGRFAGNVILSESAAEEVGEMSGERLVGGGPKSDRTTSRYGGGQWRPDEKQWQASAGRADRYFRRFRYVARAPTSERVRGLEHWHWIGDPQHPEGWRRLTTAEALEVAREDPRHLMTGSNHPTLKPLELTRWVARLILPPPAETARSIRVETTGSASRLLVPFSGVLSEAIGAGLAGWEEIVAVELSDSYVAQGADRWRAWGPFSPARAEKIERAGGMPKDEPHPEQAELFA